MPSDKSDKLLLKWTFLDPEPVDRPGRWFLFFGLVITALMVWSVLTLNWLFFVILFLAAFLILYRVLSHPESVNVEIRKNGILVGEDFYHFADIDYFWLVYGEEGKGYLNLYFKGLLKHQLVVPIWEIDPERVRRILSQFIEEDLDHEETFSDLLARILRI